MQCRIRLTLARRGVLSTDAGFTLAEMAIVVAITGCLLAAAATIATPILRTARKIETDQKLANIARAIDYYAGQNYRVPCPASPDPKSTEPPWGFEAGSGKTGNHIPADCGPDPARWEGIVPYRTLNIPADWIRDSWGNYITYAVSPAFAQDVSNPALPVHRRCRTGDWFNAGILYEHGVTDPKTGKTPPNILLPKAERKARFCCPGALPGTDIVVLDVNGQPQIAIPRQTSAASYQPSNITYPDPFTANVPVPDNDRVTAPVYILVSHGADAYGAWSHSGRISFSSANATPAEIENADSNRTFVEIPPVDRAGREKSFDDIVIWRTQDMILAGQGKSCSLP
jgi:prepilin-type N-terminal cleavage/methylation domain-containing protein